MHRDDMAGGVGQFRFGGAPVIAQHFLQRRGVYVVLPVQAHAFARHFCVRHSSLLQTLHRLDTCCSDAIREQLDVWQIGLAPATIGTGRRATVGVRAVNHHRFTGHSGGISHQLAHLSGGLAVHSDDVVAVDDDRPVALAHSHGSRPQSVTDGYRATVEKRTETA